MSDQDVSSIKVSKPDHPHKPHDVLADADKVSMFPNGRPRMQAIFETVSQQIAIGLEQAKAAATKEDAIAVFQATYDEYQKNRVAIIDKLDRLVTQ